MSLLAVGAGWRRTLADDDVIRLRPGGQATPPPNPDAIASRQDTNEFGAMRRGFEYGAFEAKLHALWFQRKAFLADGRHDDAKRQAEKIRSFCQEEGVHRLEFLAGALIAEARRSIDDGQYELALESLDFASTLDPGRPQIHWVRTVGYWKSSEGLLATGAELLSTLRQSVVRAFRDLSLFSDLGLVALLALLISATVFSILAVGRYHVAFRHEVHEWLGQWFPERWAQLAAWALLGLPLLLWFSAGWVSIYWITITFRFMGRAERWVAATLLLALGFSVPAYRTAVSVYGMTADPLVRTTLASATGSYDPNRIIELQRLVQAHPEDPTYRFLLAGLYKQGRYFEDAFNEYKAALARDPYMYQAYINVGNIFYTTGQHADAITYYRRALEIDDASALAMFNMHLAQSESFRFKEAELALLEARAIDPDLVTDLLSAVGQDGSRVGLQDATLATSSLWTAALAGRSPHDSLSAAAPQGAMQEADASWQLWLNPVSAVSALALLCCGIAALTTRTREPARRCIRCGRPFCQYCKSNREGHEYCSQCYHLYVLGDGLAQETKTHKMYEVARHERRSRSGKRWLSTLLPGTGQIAGGRPARGLILLFLWFAALIAWQPLILLPLERFVGLHLRLDLMRPGNVPAMFNVNPHVFLASVMLIVVWSLGNLWRFRGREI